MRIRFKLPNILMTMTLLIFSSTVFSEYYFVYPKDTACCVKKTYQSSCRSIAKKKIKHRYKYVARKKSSHATVTRYNMYQTCNGKVLIPKCGGGCATYIANTYAEGSRCDNFYVPAKYYRENIYPEYQYYDADPDWDMRTRDDY